MKKVLIFFLCAMALLLPWRLRVMFAKALGGLGQGVYLLQYTVTRKIIEGLKEGEKKP